MSWASMLRKATGTAPVLDLENQSKSPFATPNAGPVRPPNYRETVTNYREGKVNGTTSSTTPTPHNTPALQPTTPPIAPNSSYTTSKSTTATKKSLSPDNSAHNNNNNSGNRSGRSSTQPQHQKSVSPPSSNTSPKNNNNNNKKTSPSNNNNSNSNSNAPTPTSGRNNNNNKNNNKKPQVSFTLSPALPQGTSTHPPPLILTATALPPPTPTNNNNNKSTNSSGRGGRRNSANNNPNNTGRKNKIIYSRSQMMNIGKVVVSGEPDARTVQAIVDTCPDIATDVCYEILRREEVRREQQFSYECRTCSLFDMSDEEINKGIVKPPPAGACDQMQELIKNCLKDCRSSRGLTFICQSPDVVFAQLRVSVLTDPKRASKKVRNMPKRCIDRIKTFLCGDGFHFPAPAQNDDNSWNRFSAALKFDKLMDNQTPLFAGLGKFWKKNHTSFEKFVQILFWKDEAPNPNNFNMISKNQMPILAACSAGDVDAAVMLMHLKFYVLADDYLFAFPFMRAVDPLKAAVLRHLCRYFFRKQTERALAARAATRK